MVDFAEEDPPACPGCGAIAGCCDKYPNCPGNPDWKLPAPGTLSDEQQARFSTQILSLIRGYYGEKAEFALAIGVPVAQLGAKGMEPGIAIYCSGSTHEPKKLEAMFVVAAHSLARAKTRKLAIEDGEPGKPKN